MHHRTIAPRDHVWHQQAIQAHRGQQVEVQFGQPMIVRQGGKAAARRGGTADHMGEDVNAAKAFDRLIGKGFAPFGRCQVGVDEFDSIDWGGPP